MNHYADTKEFCYTGYILLLRYRRQLPTVFYIDTETDQMTAISPRVGHEQTGSLVLCNIRLTC